jgi:hypothetical protein
VKVGHDFAQEGYVPSMGVAGCKAEIKLKNCKSFFKTVREVKGSKGSMFFQNLKH